MVEERASGRCINAKVQGDEIVAYLRHLGVVRFLTALIKDYPKTSCRNKVTLGDDRLASFTAPDIKLHDVRQESNHVHLAVVRLRRRIRILICISHE